MDFLLEALCDRMGRGEGKGRSGRKVELKLVIDSLHARKISFEMMRVGMFGDFIFAAA